jgi:schlafen family protein
MSDPDRQAVRKGLARLAAHGAASVWLPESQVLVELPAVQKKLHELGPGAEEDALVAALRDAVAQLGQSQYRRLLTIVLALDDAYAGLSARERREIAGREFRGGTRPVSWGTIRQHHEPRALDELTSVLVSEMAQGAVTALRQRAEWHPLVHQRWANERLSFLRLGLADYDAEETVQWVHGVMREVGVRSWSLHELLGHWDVLIRAWVPAAITELEYHLQRALRGRGLTMMDRFDVEEVVSHWPWAREGERTMMRPAAVDLEWRITDREIAQLDAGAETARSVAALAEERNLRTVAEPARGIGFMVSVRLPPVPHTRNASAVLTEQVSRLLANQEHISETSLYRGVGFGDHLIFGKVHYDKFHELRRSLLAPLREIGVGLSRPTATTVILATSDALISEEALPLAAPRQPHTIEELLRQPEGPRLEVRGTAFMTLVSQGGQLVARPSDGGRDTLLRTVAAMLNSDGGTIVIGAVEASRFADRASLDDLPRVGEYAVFGIGHETEGGRDRFQRRLMDACSSAIEPNPIRSIDVEFADVEERTIAVLTIRPPSTGGEWFYVRGKAQRYEFYVRSGAATAALSGPEADRYKSTVGRRTPGVR